MNSLRAVVLFGLFVFRACNAMTLETVFKETASRLNAIPRELQEKVIGMTPLLIAARDGALKVVEDLLADPAEAIHFNKPDMLGRTPLSVARNNGHTEIIEKLEIYACTTPLHVACRAGDLEAVNGYLADPALSAQINTPDRLGRTPLILACDNGHHEIVALLLSLGALRDAGVLESTPESARYHENPGPWLEAARRGHVEVVKLLLPANSECLLMEAARNGQESVVATLLAIGIDPNSYGDNDWLALHHAAAYGHANVVKLLLDAGADRDITTDRGEKPLHLAAEGGHATVVTFLSAQGALLDPLLLFSSAARGQVEVVKLLLRHYESFQEGKDSLRYLLSTAAKMDQGGIVATLLAAGVDPNERNQRGWTPLCTAAHSGHLELVRLLLDAGAQLNIPTPRFSLNHVLNQKKMLKLVIAPEQNTCNCTPLALAAQQGHTAIVEELLTRGAAADEIDDFDWTPLCRASYNGHKETVRALLAHNANINHKIDLVQRFEDSEDSPAAESIYASTRGAAADEIDDFDWTPLCSSFL